MSPFALKMDPGKFLRVGNPKIESRRAYNEGKCPFWAPVHVAASLFWDAKTVNLQAKK